MSVRTRQDGEFWASLFEREHRRLCTVAVAWLGGMDDALDLVQDVFVRIVERGVHIESPMSYCVKSIRNAAIDRLRRDRDRPTLISLGPACEGIIDAAAARSESQRHAAEFAQVSLARLHPNQREVIVLKIYAGLTFSEIAEALDTPQGTIATHYRRGIEAMRRMVEERSDDAA
ncbi:MAG TPA: sigma-70 family RNA polymerase sigma factor [Phycisphaerae bacterium]|nr:sigma-70 family RNA polymerase sigma factor [Phycisphaerae bacterium]HRW54408.1 sigma-70 family RNA polymerase sigma factor [Phycisphaerae bacterium]